MKKSTTKELETSTKTDMKFVDNDYLYTTFTLTSLTKESLDDLISVIKSSFFFKEVVNFSVGRTLEVYKSLSNLNAIVNPKEFHSFVDSKSSEGFFHLQTYNREKEIYEMYDERIHHTFILQPIFKTNENNDNSDFYRLQLTEFYFMNHPLYKGDFKKTLTKITNEVVKVAQSMDPDFKLTICSLLCSLPGGGAQTIHQDDWRDIQKDDMLSCIVSLQSNTKLYFSKRFNDNKNKRKKGVPEEVNLHLGGGVLFSGTSKHAGCGYEDMNIRLHFFIFKEDAQETYDLFARDYKQITFTCDICGKYVQPYNQQGRKLMNLHKRRHGKEVIG